MLIKKTKQFIIRAALLGAIANSSFASETSFPLHPGEIGPIAKDGTSRTLQYPFSCQTVAAGLGESVNQDCGAPMQVTYYYKPIHQAALLPLPRNSEGQYYPNDVDYSPNNLPNFFSPGGKYIVRVERGVINRFIYMIAVLEDVVAHKTPALSGYGNKALYYFDGGSGLGHTQASNSALAYINEPSRMIKDIDILGLGYAVLYSTGTATSTHYNLNLGLKTAQMVKDQFTAEFGKPDLTLGLGGSGGAIQGLIYGEKDPSLLNGLILLAAFPDMITQTNYISDCPLLEYYFDNLAHDAPTPWNIRGLIEGLNSSEAMPLSKQALPSANPNPKLQSIITDKGSNTCVNGWNSVAHSLINPFSEENNADKWSLWDDQSNRWQYGTYPINDDSLAYNTLDNEGVQYGLQALRLGQIDKERFLDLNAKVGGWKKENEFINEKNYPMSGEHGQYDGWSSQNATAGTILREAATSTPAPRKSANLSAIKAAMDNHLIFTGNITLPILEIRVNNDDKGDIHNAFESLVIRSRLQKFNRAGQHVLWLYEGGKFSEDADGQNYWGDIAKMSDFLMSSQSQSDGLQNNIVIPSYYYQPITIPILMMEQWVRNIKNYPTSSILQNKPALLHDGCFLQEKKFLPRFSDTVWDGALDASKKTKGFCAQHVVFHPTSRVVAGENISDSQLKCPLISVDEFIKLNGYGKIAMTAAEIARIKLIFPTGVCKQ